MRVRSIDHQTRKVKKILMSQKRTPILLVLLLAGCTTSSNPIPTGYTGPLARISDSCKTHPPQSAYFFEVTKIDGKTIATSSEATSDKGTFALDPTALARDVPARKCTLSLRATDVRVSYGDDFEHKYQNPRMFVVTGEITVTLEPNKEYFVTGNLTPWDSWVCLKSRDGTFVSAKIEKHLPQQKADH